MGVGINFELNWDCVTLRYTENNTVALIFLGVNMPLPSVLRD